MKISSSNYVLYQHMKYAYSGTTKTTEIISSGTTIGYVGGTGGSITYGNHLHIEFLKSSSMSASNWLQAEKTIKFNDYYDISWSIAEAIYEFDIPRESIEEILNGYMSDENGVIITEVYADGSEIPISGNTLMYEYDLDMVYDDNSEIAELLISEPQSTASELQVSDTELQGYEVDEMIRK